MVFSLQAPTPGKLTFRHGASFLEALRISEVNKIKISEASIFLTLVPMYLFLATLFLALTCDLTQLKDDKILELNHEIQRKSCKAMKAI